MGRIFKSDSSEAFGLTSYSFLPNGFNFAESLALTDSDLILEMVCTARALSDSLLEQSKANRMTENQSAVVTNIIFKS